MAILDIIEIPDERLREHSEAVSSFDDDLQQQVDDLFETLGHSGAIGLSAPQAGILKRIIVVHVPDDDFGARVYINPEILKRSKSRYVEESCLSVPGIEGNVVRCIRVTLRAQDVHGKLCEFDVDGLHAVCVQHEMDHLDGILFTDRLSWFKKLRLRMASGGNTGLSRAA